MGDGGRLAAVVGAVAVPPEATLARVLDVGDHVSSFEVRDDSTLEPPYLGRRRTRHDCSVTLSTTILLPALRRGTTADKASGAGADATSPPVEIRPF
jgi:hypothetical protein